MTRNLTIGIAGPFTGPRSAYGALLSTAVERAQPWFTPLWGDDQAQVAKAEAVARRFVASGVDAVVGHSGSKGRFDSGRQCDVGDVGDVGERSDNARHSIIPSRPTEGPVVCCDVLTD